MRSIQESADVRQRYEAALEAFADKLRPDPNVIAILICGSMSNDVVWEKSDMDIVVVVRDVKMAIRNFCIEEDGIILNVDLMKEFDFKRYLGKSEGGGFAHSLYSDARIVYTTDESMQDYLNDLKGMGADDRALSFFRYASWLIGDMEKIEKWLEVKNDVQYAQYWILKAADIYAVMLLILNNQPISREAILKVLKFAPEKMQVMYVRPMNGLMTEDEVRQALDDLHIFLCEHIDLLEQPVKDYMSDGAVRTVTTLVKHFGMNSHSIYHVFDFLEETGVVCRVSETIKITPKSRMAVEEVAYMYIKDGGNQWHG